MGWGFRKSIKLGPVRLNLSKGGGLGASIGVKGLRVGTGPRGARLSASIPGTGIRYTKSLGAAGRVRAGGGSAIGAVLASADAANAEHYEARRDLLEAEREILEAEPWRADALRQEAVRRADAARARDALTVKILLALGAIGLVGLATFGACAVCSSVFDTETAPAVRAAPKPAPPPAATRRR